MTDSVQGSEKRSESGASVDRTGGLQISDLSVVYGNQPVPAVDSFSLSVPKGEFAILLGHSGSGKSTVLNACAGLVTPTAGSVTVDGRVMVDRARSINLQPNKRHLGVVFQSYALWPHMTVRENVEYPLRRRKVRGTALARAVDDALELVDCARYGDRYPGALSGGQQQRVALARAIVAEPELLLFDEPLSNLDASLRRQLRSEIASLHQRVGFTALYVTHDHSEALGLGTSLTIMEGGKLIQTGSPREVHSRPTSVTAAKFFGANVWRVDPQPGTSVIPSPVGPVEGAGPGEKDIAVYPHNIRIEPDPSSNAVIRLARFLGSSTEYVCDVDGHTVRVSGDAVGIAAGPGDRVRLSAAPSAVYVYDAS